MADVTLKINGQEVTVEKGTTILEAAKNAGIYIPVLCYHPFLPLEEACRICVVEDNRGEWSTLVAACVFPARNGMVIETDSEMVLEARKTILELLLSDHPNECMTCQAAGDCELQDLAYRYQVGVAAYEGERHHFPVDSDPNPYLHVNMNKCVLCRRCIRACHDVQGADIWAKVGRGFDQHIATAFGLPLVEAGCEMCGHCADFCPVDAIGLRAGRGEVRSWETKKGSTVCLQCPSGCRAQYESYGSKVVRVRGDFDSPSNRGALCKVGRFNFNFINSPDRLTKAYLRNEKGELAPASVDEALQTAATALTQVKDTAGGNKVGIICGGMLTNEEYYLAQKLARGALATNNVDNIAGPWQQAIYEGLGASVGFGAMTNSLEEIAKAGAILALGANTLEKQAIAALKARKAAREGAVLIVANPQEIAFTKTAGMHLALKEGSEDALVTGLIKVIVDEKLYDQEYVDQYTQDFDKMLKNVEKISMAEVVEKTGLSEDRIREAARLYASKRPASLVYGADLNTTPPNEAFYRRCAALQLLLGSVGVEGGGVNVMGCAGNAQGAADFGALPKYLPGYRLVTQSSSRKAVSKVWGVEPPDKGGLSWPEMIDAMEKGQIKVLYLMGVDPFELGLPKEKVQKALSGLNLLIVQDSVKTEAANMAHVVLPASTFVEKDGTATNCERRVQQLTKVMDSPGDARSDFDLINGLLAQLKPELKVDGRSGVFAEATQLIKELGDLSVDQITKEGIQLPFDAGKGTSRLSLPEEGKSKFKFKIA